MPLGRIDEETTANIGRFEGGTQTNIVCDQVDILAEARSLVPEKMEKQTEKMKQAFEAAAAEMGAEPRWKSKSCTRALNTKTGISSLKSPKSRRENRPSVRAIDERRRKRCERHRRPWHSDCQPCSRI